jgi:hypothetical protein
MDAFFASMAKATEQASDRRDASRRIANVPLVNTSATAEQRRGAVAARLPVATRPDRRQDAYAAGVAQADQSVPIVAAFWSP